MTIVVPKHHHPRSCWPRLVYCATRSLRLERNSVRRASWYFRQGEDMEKLRGPSIRALGMRVSFSCGWSDFEGGSFAAQHPVLLVSDLMFKGMRGFGWPASLVARLRVNGGARLGVLCSVLAEPCRAKKPELAVLDGGVNDISKAGSA